jgi:hypothetical protein
VTQRKLIRNVNKLAIKNLKHYPSVYMRNDEKTRKTGSEII